MRNVICVAEEKKARFFKLSEKVRQLLGPLYATVEFLFASLTGLFLLHLAAHIIYFILALKFKVFVFIA